RPGRRAVRPGQPHLRLRFRRTPGTTPAACRAARGRQRDGGPDMRHQFAERAVPRRLPFNGWITGSG
ncbi:hypothetical protein ACPF8X_13520, partial [Streptomyces sp. G35A]